MAQHESSSTSSSRRRFRSLSLMDPAQKSPFTQQSCSSSDHQHSTSMENIEDEMCSPTANSLNKDRYTNIYVHDGQFGESSTTPPRRRSRKCLRVQSRNNSSNGLIPPEFYSRISSPSSSASSSASSLQNLNILPGTFSKLVGAKGEESSGSDTHSIFEKNLIKKSFEEVRRQPSINLFSTLLGGNDANRFALNFKSNKQIPVNTQYLDEEDMMMSSGFNNSIETSEDDEYSHAGSVTTLIAENEENRSSVTPSLNKLNLCIYDGDAKQEEQKVDKIEPEKKTALKKPKFTLDLYGDDELDSSGGWILGGNAR